MLLCSAGLFATDTDIMSLATISVASSQKLEITSSLIKISRLLYIKWISNWNSEMVCDSLKVLATPSLI